MDVIEQTDGTLIDLESKLLQSRIIIINEEIDNYTVGNYQMALYHLAKENHEPIVILINSPGGSVYDGLGLYDTIQDIKSMGITVVTRNVGLCASFGAILLLAGTKGHRQSYKNCSIMFHELSTLDIGTVSVLEEKVKESKRLQNILNQIIIDNCDFNPELMKKTDYWLDANQALELNIIDKIV